MTGALFWYLVLLLICAGLATWALEWAWRRFDAWFHERERQYPWEGDR
ncbi:MAG: hypothetical protein ABIX37_10795 [Gammaproteobacteria bacterium]